MTGLNQNLNRAFVLFELTHANKISLLDPYERTLGKCCNDPLRPPNFPGPDPYVVDLYVVLVDAILFQFPGSSSRPLLRIRKYKRDWTNTAIELKLL